MASCTFKCIQYFDVVMWYFAKGQLGSCVGSRAVRGVDLWPKHSNLELSGEIFLVVNGVG